MATSLPFPSLGKGGGHAPAQKHDAAAAKHHSQMDGMRIDIPHKGSKGGTGGGGGGGAGGDAAHSTTHLQPHQNHQTHHPSAKEQQAQQQHGSLRNTQHANDASGGAAVPPRGSSAQQGPWQHRPRPPATTADSYFPNSGSHSQGSSMDAPPPPPPPSTQGGGQPPHFQPRTPGSMRGHSRQASGTAVSAMAAGPPATAQTPGTGGGRRSSHQMQLSLSNNGAVAGQGGAEGFEAFGHAGPPSPSTLTDIILGIHSTLYGAKRTPEEVREMVGRFYDRDAIFESPLLAAKGREQIANQFIMAFTLPGMDVTSELRDVICSDFEFDGTRAGIIDQTISVTFLPSLFGTSNNATAEGAKGSYPHSAHPGQSFFEGSNHNRGGSATPAYTLQSAVTPHPFASYSQSHTPAGPGSSSMFSRFGHSQGHSPTTPYSLSGMWGGLGGSRPHTPGQHVPSSSHMRPLSSHHPQGARPSTPPSVNGDFDDYVGDSASEQMGNSSTTVMGDDDVAGGPHHLIPNNQRLSMPQDAVTPHWSAQGLGRMSMRAFLWGVFHPRAVLKHLCTIHLRLMSRLEFNDAGQIVRHEDTWGVRETIEGTIPFASLIYALERRIVGHICSFAVGRGFRLSSALARHAIGPHSHEDDDHHHQRGQWRAIEGGHGGPGSEYSIHRPDANEAAHALLLGYNRHSQMMSMARSRASSPTRNRYSIHGHGPYTTIGPGSSAAYSRSRARSLVGGPQSAGPARAASSDNLLGVGAAAAAAGSGYGERERGSTHGGETLPPDSSARYRGGSRRTATSTASAPPMGSAAIVPGGGHDGTGHASYDGATLGGWDAVARARAPDRDDP